MYNCTPSLDSQIVSLILNLNLSFFQIPLPFIIAHGRGDDNSCLQIRDSYGKNIAGSWHYEEEIQIRGTSWKNDGQDLKYPAINFLPKEHGDCEPQGAGSHVYKAMPTHTYTHPPGSVLTGVKGGEKSLGRGSQMVSLFLITIPYFLLCADAAFVIIKRFYYNDDLF